MTFWTASSRFVARETNKPCFITSTLIEHFVTQLQDQLISVGNLIGQRQGHLCLL